MVAKWRTNADSQILVTRSEDDARKPRESVGNKVCVRKRGPFRSSYRPFHSVDAHRGGRLTKLGHVFLKTLQSEGEDQPTTPEVRQRTSGPNTPTPQTEEDQEDVEPEAAATVSATTASLARGSTDADLYDLAIAARAARTTYSQGTGETRDKKRVKDAEMLRQASAAAPAAGAEVPSSC